MAGPNSEESTVFRVELKVPVPDNRDKDDFFKLLLKTAAEGNDSFLWEVDLDIVEANRASVEAVLGEQGFAFMEGTTLLVITCDFAKKEQAVEACRFFQRLTASSWDVEITWFSGERACGEILNEP